MDAREVIKRLNDEFVPALGILCSLGGMAKAMGWEEEAARKKLDSLGGGPLELQEPSGIYYDESADAFYRLLREKEDAPAWRVWGAFSGVRVANTQEKEDGERLVSAHIGYDYGVIDDYLQRTHANGVGSDEDRILNWRASGVEWIMHGFLCSEIVPFLTKYGLGNDELNELIAPFPADLAALAHTENLTAQLDAAHARIAELERQIDTGTPPYLDPSHPRHAPKLAAAIRAWEAISRVPNLKKSPKAALADWLASNEKAPCLSKQAIEECSAVANWNQKGGVPKSTSQ